jgi:hypothetical protein
MGGLSHVLWLLTLAVFAQSHKTSNALRRSPAPIKLHMLGDRGRTGLRRPFRPGRPRNPGGSWVAPPVPKPVMSHQMKLSFVFAVTVLLCGCIADQKNQLASCEADATRKYPGKTWHGASASTEMAGFIQACMKTAGYAFTCGPHDSALSGSYACYRPSSEFGSWSYEIERWLRQL